MEVHFAIEVTSATAPICDYPADDLTIARLATDSRLEATAWGLR